MFHAKEGLFFERQPFGDVRVIKTRDQNPPNANGTNVEFELTLGRAVFASIVAGMTCRGYSQRTYHEAYETLRTEPTNYANLNSEEIYGG